ncbi:EAL domain-containing protein [Actinotalea solisilvae]|uniref:EAL domain-containing protein n=1 Tax=Actinotalea solisilvae TaxID=2072922 RepID=UPI0018F24D65|nr:EAL domain-containing protein [Actinotalea solisilvae]
MTHLPTLLVLSPSTGGYYFGSLLSGIARELAAAGGRAVVVQTLEPGMRSDEIGEAPEFTTRVAWDEVDGAVSITSAARSDYLTALQGTGRPVVMASNVHDDLVAPAALPDNRGGTAAAVEHLVAHGHTRIGFVGNLAQRDIRDRYDAYLATLEAHGLRAVTADLFDAPDNGESGGHAAAGELLRAESRPTALMVATDRNATGVLDVLRSAGVDVPGDIAVVGFDNIENASFTSPALTTVDQPFDEVGALAARLVLARVAGKDVPATPHAAPATLVVRSSCGCGTAGDAPVAARRRSTVRAIAENRVHRALARGGAHDADLAVTVEEIVTLVDDLVAAGTAASPADVEQLATRLRRQAPRADVLRTVTRALDEHVRATSSAERSALLLAGLRDVQAAAFLRQSAAVELMLDEQFGVDVGLLDTVAGDPRSLRWLAGTHVRSALLATRTPDGGLTVAGVYDPDERLAARVGDATRVEEFPPRDLVLSALPEARQLCFVLPVRTRERDWGLLALVAEIEMTSARETYHHWASLLAAALEQQALQAAVHASEERYALVAEAAHDGLWDVDLRTGREYLSDRCRDLLCLAEDDRPDLRTWRTLVHDDDLERVVAAMVEARRTTGVAVEVEFRVRACSEGTRWLLSRCLAVAGPDGEAVRLVGSLSDISQRRALEERLRHGALYDEVTGLPNRRLFLDRLTHAVQQRERRREARFAVVFLDLDGFKLVNDSLGHLVGDELLVVVADRLRGVLRSVDIAARFGGDEFAVLLSDPVPDEVLVIARRIQERIAQPVVLAGHEVSVTASVGIATSETGYADPEDVLRDADIAMYDAKAAERGSASVFDPEMHARASGRLRARAELRSALADGQFVVHYQPIVALDGAGLAHFEALVRWQHPTRGLLLPGAFLPAMEDNASVVALGQWVLDEVCRQVAAWEDEHRTPATVSVNLSHQEFWSRGLVHSVRSALARHGVAPERLVLEITESVIMDDPDVARGLMTELHALGVRLHIDDFGTGQSSLHALRSFPVDALKIDGSFIRELGDVRQTTELVRIIVEIGAVLGMDVVAECVETSDQAQRLREMGCANAQGWLYAKALPGDEAGALLGRALVGALTP